MGSGRSMIEEDETENEMECRQHDPSTLLHGTMQSEAENI
jgi:hypothetical protein